MMRQLPVLIASLCLVLWLMPAAQAQTTVPAACGIELADMLQEMEAKAVPAPTATEPVEMDGTAHRRYASPSSVHADDHVVSKGWVKINPNDPAGVKLAMAYACTNQLASTCAVLRFFNLDPVAIEADNTYWAPIRADIAAEIAAGTC